LYGFGYSGSDKGREVVKNVSKYFESINATTVGDDG
jgi:hypothetical protein